MCVFSASKVNIFLSIFRFDTKRLNLVIVKRERGRVLRQNVRYHYDSDDLYLTLTARGMFLFQNHLYSSVKILQVIIIPKIKGQR